MITRSANPGLNKNTFTKIKGFELSDNRMTLQGTVNKTGILLLIALMSAFYVWRQFFVYENPNISLYIFGGAIGSYDYACLALHRNPPSTI